jgi:hypothetical protein
MHDRENEIICAIAHMILSCSVIGVSHKKSIFPWKSRFWRAGFPGVRRAGSEGRSHVAVWSGILTNVPACLMDMHNRANEIICAIAHMIVTRSTIGVPQKKSIFPWKNIFSRAGFSRRQTDGVRGSEPRRRLKRHSNKCAGVSHIHNRAYEIICAIAHMIVSCSVIGVSQKKSTFPWKSRFWRASFFRRQRFMNTFASSFWLSGAVCEQFSVCFFFCRFWLSIQFFRKIIPNRRAGATWYDN